MPIGCRKVAVAQVGYDVIREGGHFGVLSIGPIVGLLVGCAALYFGSALMLLLLNRL